MQKGVLLLSFLLLAAVRLVAQQHVDSTTTSHLDSLQARLKNGVNAKPSHALDTLGPNVRRYTHSLDSMKRCVTHRIDSLRKLNLPTAHYSRKLDSLNRIDPLKAVKQQEARLGAAERKVTSTITGLENKVTQGLNSITKEAEGGVTIPNTAIPGASLPGTNLPLNSNLTNPLALPNTTLPQMSNPINGNLSGMGDIQKEIGSVSGLPQKELSELTSGGELNIAEKSISQATQGAAGYEKDLTNITKTDVQSAENLPKTLEGEAKNVDGVKDLQKETQLIDGYKKIYSSADDPEALKKEALEQAQKQAINHFAGKEQVLTGAMNQVSKIKQRYSNVTSLSNLPKRPPNPMKGKPWNERVLPGLTFAVLKLNRNTMIDFNPWIAYRFTGRVTAGGGWNERIEISHFRFSNQQVYGPRIFGEYKLGRGFSGRLEVETMNTNVPPSQTPGFRDPSGRAWVWNSFGGLKREYKLFKHLRGNVQMLYNLSSLYAHHRINLYGDPLTVRMGFEFPMKKEK